MTDQEAYLHGYNGTLKLEELLEALPPAKPHNYDEPTQVDAWRSGGQDAQQDEASDTEECDMEPDDFMSDGEADADALPSAGWGTDGDYGFFG